MGIIKGRNARFSLGTDGVDGVTGGRAVPENPVPFIQDCVRDRRIFWTYHVNMRLADRFIPRESILAAVETYELVEGYPDDKYLPSYLVLARYKSDAFHVLFATDVEGDNVRVVTSYRPSAEEWENKRIRRSEK